MSTILRIDDFLASLKAIPHDNNEQYRKAVNALCKSEIDYLRHHVALTTLRRYCTEYRNAVRKHFNGRDIPLSYRDKKTGLEAHIALKYLVLKRSEVQEYVSHEIERKKGFLDVFSGKRLVVVNTTEMITVATNLTDSDSVYDMAAGLLFLTGRRAVEIWKLAHFAAVENEEYQLIFSGQAKTRGSVNSHDSYRIFTLCSGNKVIDTLSKIRTAKDMTGFSEHEVHNKTSTQLGRVVKKHFARFIPNYGELIEPKDLRSIYVHVAHHLHAPHTVITEFARQLLGHVYVGTAENYMVFRIE